MGARETWGAVEEGQPGKGGVTEGPASAGEQVEGPGSLNKGGTAATSAGLWGTRGCRVGGWVLAAAALCALLGTEVWRASGGRSGRGGGSAPHASSTSRLKSTSSVAAGEGGGQLPWEQKCCMVQTGWNETDRQRADRQRAVQLALLQVDPLMSGPPPQGVLYVTWEEGHTALLGRALAGMQEHWCSRIEHYALLVLQAFPASDADRSWLRAQAPACRLDFHELKSVAGLPAGMERKRRLLQAHMFEVPALLSRYEWVAHMTDHTLLGGDVVVDPLAALHGNGTGPSVGYVGTTGQGPGTGALWEAAKQAAQAERLPVSSCALRLTWESPKSLDPRFFAYRPSLVTASHTYLRFMQQLRPLVTSANRTRDLPSPAAVFTAGALLSLPPSAFLRLPPSLLPDLQLPEPGDPATTAVLGADADGSALPASVHYKDGVTITASEASDLQPLFDARKKGWLGADVATSFRFPPPPSTPFADIDPKRPPDASAPGARSQQSLWLFGDTFVGFSSRTRRLPDAFFLHNTVATTPRFPPPASPSTRGRRRSLQPSDVSFHWNVSAGGCPTSVFVRTVQDNECSLTHSYLWPVSGLGVALPDGNNGSTVVSRLIVTAIHWSYMGPPTSSELLTNDTFNFAVLGTTLMVVDNPHDPPHSWNIRTKDIPGTDGDHNWYSAMALADGHKDLATSTHDTVYLFGNNGTKAFGPPDELSAQVVARVSVGSLLDLSLADMQVWTQPKAGEEAGGATWVAYKDFLDQHRSAVKVAAPVYSETSVNYSPFLGKWYSTQVDWLNTVVTLYLADDVTGPWDALPVYTIPPPFSDLNYFFTYAGKAHPELAGGHDEIIITYVANTYGDIDPLFQRGAKGIYVPRFVRLQLAKAAAPALLFSTHKQQQQQQP